MKEMTKKERVLAAIAKQPVDHVPASFSLHFPKGNEYGEKALAAHMTFLRETDVDILKIMNENLVPEANSIVSPEDWGKIPAYSLKSPFMRRQVDLVKACIQEAGSDVYPLATVHGVCASAIHPIEALYGYVPVRELQVKHFRMNKKPLLDAFQRITDAMCELSVACIREGALGIYYAALGGEKHFFTDEEFAEVIAPFDKQILSAVKEAGGHVFLHICKENLQMNRYESYRPLVDVVNWGVYEAPYTLQQGRTLFPDATLMGGLQNRSGVLVDGSLSQLREEVRSVLDITGETGFILGADCTLPTEIPCERIMAAVHAAIR